MSVAGRFDQLLGKLSPSEQDLDRAIATHRRMREELVHRRDWIKETFLTGSYKRKTAIHPLNDVDFFCVVDSSWARGKTPQQIQREVQRVLQEIYPQTPIHRQKHSLGVAFPSQEIGYDVIPAVPVGTVTHMPYKIIHRETGDGTFIPSNPGATEAAKEEANSRGGPGGRMLQMIRLVKHWNYKNYKKLKSFHLELLCYGAAPTMASCTNNREACARLFEFLSRAVLRDCFVPGVPRHGDEAVQSNLRNTRSDHQLQNVAGELAAAAKKANNAIAWERTNPTEAHRIWETLFGEVY